MRPTINIVSISYTTVEPDTIIRRVLHALKEDDITAKVIPPGDNPRWDIGNGGYEPPEVRLQVIMSDDEEDEAIVDWILDNIYNLIVDMTNYTYTNSGTNVTIADEIYVTLKNVVITPYSNDEISVVTHVSILFL